MWQTRTRNASLGSLLKCTCNDCSEIIFLLLCIIQWKWYFLSLYNNVCSITRTMARSRYAVWYLRHRTDFAILGIIASNCSIRNHYVYATFIVFSKITLFILTGQDFSYFNNDLHETESLTRVDVWRLIEVSWSHHDQLS